MTIGEWRHPPDGERTVGNCSIVRLVTGGTKKKEPPRLRAAALRFQTASSSAAAPASDFASAVTAAFARPCPIVAIAALAANVAPVAVVVVTATRVRDETAAVTTASAGRRPIVAVAPLTAGACIVRTSPADTVCHDIAIGAAAITPRREPVAASLLAADAGRIIAAFAAIDDRTTFSAALAPRRVPVVASTFAADAVAFAPATPIAVETAFAARNHLTARVPASAVRVEPAAAAQRAHATGPSAAFPVTDDAPPIGAAARR